MVGVNVVAAETDAEARRLFTRVQQAFTNLHRGRPRPLQPPIDDIDDVLDAAEKVRSRTCCAYAVVGAPETVRARPGASSSRRPAPTS